MITACWTLEHHRASVTSSSWESARGEPAPSSITVLYARHSHTGLQTAQSYDSFGAPIVATLLGTQRTIPLGLLTHDSGAIELRTEEFFNITRKLGKVYHPKVVVVIIINVFSWLVVILKKGAFLIQAVLLVGVCRCLLVRFKAKVCSLYY